jgi:hypothetical protein
MGELQAGQNNGAAILSSIQLLLSFITLVI